MLRNWKHWRKQSNRTNNEVELILNPLLVLKRLMSDVGILTDYFPHDSIKRRINRVLCR